MRAAELPASLLGRKAIVYVRQSTQAQVHGNIESQRRQYDLVGLARSYGFSDVDIIDDDLGRSASGTVERPGFQALVSQICAGVVGAVVCLEASRLARNGRDWHHLLELCGLVDARVIDAEGLYDPRIPNDRLLLGLKGTMSEFELNILRSRMEDARAAKARRGELRLPVPVGYLWSADGLLDLNPDRRVQEAVGLVFHKFLDLGSAYQVLRWMRDGEISFPTATDGKRPADIIWRMPSYRHIIAVLKNPFYAGVYAYGKTGKRTVLVEGHARKSYGHARPMEAWTVFLRDHHRGYITWSEYERNQQQLATNTFCRPDERSKSGRGGRALLAALLRCRRCGRRLQVVYSGRRRAGCVRYSCNRGQRNHGLDSCINFGAFRPDEAVSREVLVAVHPTAVEAAMTAHKRLLDEDADRRRAVALELEQARYEAQLAARRYEACDPDNRLVAAELESRWNAAMRKARTCEERSEVAIPVAPCDTRTLLTLAGDLDAVWRSDRTDMRTKQRIVRVLIEEIIVDVDDQAGEVVLLIHWRGGQHSELRAKKPRTGEHRRRAAPEAIEVVRSMAGRWTDEHIAASLNRMGLATGQGNTWTAPRVRGIRQKKGIRAYRSAEKDGTWLTMYEAAEKLGVTSHVIRRLVTSEVLPATQVVPDAPWQIRASDLASDEVRRTIADRPRRGQRPCRSMTDTSAPMFPGFPQGDVE